MDKANLIKSVTNGETPERLPYSFWTHMPGIDLDAEKLAEATYGFFKEYDLDLIKTMPNGMYSVQDWGCECDFSQIAKGGVAKVVSPAVKAPEDWKSLGILDVHQGAMGRELKALELLLKRAGGAVPVIATVFTPMTTAHKLSAGKVLDHYKSDPEKVREGLAAITETTRRLAARAVELGCAGVFLATQLCTEQMMAADEYTRYCRESDLAVLDAVKDSGWFNVIHVHGDNIHFDRVKDYPVHGFSWHIWETPPSLEDFLAATKNKVIVGGLQRGNISKGRVDLLEKDIEECCRITGGRHLLLAPGCTIRHPVEPEIVKATAARIKEFDPGKPVKK